MQQMDCVFCGIVGGRKDAYVLYEDADHMAFLDRYPVVPGHTLIIPRQHYSTINEMSPDSVGRLFSLVPRLAPAVLGATGAGAFNVGQNNGHAAKQVVPHVHVHIIPRRDGDRINWTARSVVDGSEFDEMAGRIRALL